MLNTRASPTFKREGTWALPRMGANKMIDTTLENTNKKDSYWDILKFRMSIYWMNSGKLIKMFEVKLIMVCINQGKKRIIARNTARIFGMKVRVNS